MVPWQVEQWRNLVTSYCEPPLLPNEALAIIWSESFGDPNANNPNDPSWGVMQVTAPIAKTFGGVTDCGTLLQPEDNIRTGCAFLSYLKKRYAEKYPNWPIAYNVGEGNLIKGVEDQNYLDAFNHHLAELNAYRAVG